MFTHRPFCHSLPLIVVFVFLTACREDLQTSTGPDPFDYIDQPVSPKVVEGMVVARVTSCTEDSVKVTWSDTESKRSAYVVERTNLGGDEFLPLVKVQSLDHAYMDVGKKEVLRLYFYRIVAMTTSGEKTYSNVVPLYLNPRRPLALRPTHVSATTIQLQWNFTGNISEGFIVERSTDNSSYVRIGVVPKNQLLYEDATLDTSVVYYYRAFTVTRYTIGPSAVPIKIAYILNPSNEERQWAMVP